MLTVRGARGNNLKNITVDFPLGVMICVTGVSGSGKSTLVNATLRAALNRYLYHSYDQPLEHDAIEGIANIDKLVVVDQSPIGRTPSRIRRPIPTCSAISGNCSKRRPTHRFAVSKQDVSRSTSRAGGVKRAGERGFRRSK